VTYYSSVPAAIAALVTAFRTSAGLGLAGVPVRDGPQVTAAPGLEAVTVGNITAARARAYQLHAACGAAIGVDRKLGGAVLQASLGIGSLRQKQTSDGALAQVVFPVNVEAYTSR
jgi:hypothetical protein